MKRVLAIVGALNIGGAEMMLMNLLRNGVKIDFFVNSGEPGIFSEEIESLGGKCYYPRKRSDSFIGHHEDLKKIVKENNYDVVHINTQNAFLCMLEMIVCRKAGAKKIITHSHNTMDWRADKLLKMHKVARKYVNKHADIKMSCGTAAAEWLYGTSEGIVNLPLPVMCRKFLFDEKIREQERINLGIDENVKVFAHVGRFSDVKNHVFLLDVFSELLKIDKHKNDILILMGDGELKPEMETKAKDLGITENVKFLGNVNDIYNKLMAADCFVFPSIYEGFPTVVLEAQASGLPCVISANITPDIIKVPDLVKQIQINEPGKDAEAGNCKSEWIKEMGQMTAGKKEYRMKANAIIAKEYDIDIVKKQIESAYRL